MSDMVETQQIAYRNHFFQKFLEHRFERSVGPFSDPLLAPQIPIVGARSGHCRRQTTRRGSRIGAGTSFVERAAFRAMEMNGNDRNSGAPQVTSKVKVYLTDKTYD